ncbi:MAG: XRE family transcriptional regulator [Chloroflexi bacterium]|nr:MAG: XRE family transcriptional regulator [Chloroflexota bacterium]
MTNKEIGRMVQHAREGRALSKMALAELSGVHPRTISRVERGVGCHVNTLRQLAAALNMRLVIRFEGEDGNA